MSTVKQIVLSPEELATLKARIETKRGYKSPEPFGKSTGWFLVPKEVTNCKRYWWEQVKLEWAHRTTVPWKRDQTPVNNFDLETGKAEYTGVTCVRSGHCPFFRNVNGWAICSGPKPDDVEGRERELKQINAWAMANAPSEEDGLKAGYKIEELQEGTKITPLRGIRKNNRLVNWKTQMSRKYGV